MSEIISDEVIENIAILAKLEIDKNEMSMVKKDMEQMLDFVEKLRGLDTDDIEAMSHVFKNTNVFRDDVVSNGDDRENMLENAPNKKEVYFCVPKTID